MPASLTEKELERLRLELLRRRAGGHMTMALSLDTVDTLLASARALRNVEALIENETLRISPAVRSTAVTRETARLLADVSNAIAGSLTCKYCKRPHSGSPASYAENPFCVACLPERIEQAKAEIGPGEMQRVGAYYLWSGTAPLGSSETPPVDPNVTREDVERALDKVADRVAAFSGPTPRRRKNR